MKFLTSFRYEFLKNLRDFKLIAILVIMPLLMIFLLGTSVKSMLSEDVSKRITVGIINSDKGPVGEGFVKFMTSGEIKKRVEIAWFYDRKIAKKAADDGKIRTFVYLPEDLSQAVNDKEKKNIIVYGKKDTEFVETLIQGFTSRYNAISTVAASGGNPSGTGNEKNLKRVFYTRKTVPPSTMEYYSVLTLLQFLVMGAILGTSVTSRTEGTDIHIRTNSLPVSRWVILSGKILANTIYLLLVSLVTILVSITVFHANWNGNPIIIFGAMFLFCATCTGIGVLTGIIVQKFSTGMIIAISFMALFGITSGAISPKITYDSINLIIPNYHAKVIIFGTINGYPGSVIINSLLWLTGIMVFVYAVSFILLRRVKYDNI